MDCEEPFQLLSNHQSTQAPLVRIVSRFLSAQEAAQIIKQFQSENWISNGQVLWSGILREKAQEWADRHHLQTLTSAMGSLMDEKHPECLKPKKNLHQWSRYVHGASALFAWHIAQGEKVTLLSPPPPERFHPSGLSYFQLIEEPIIRGLVSQNAVQKILITHPMIEESEDEEFYYELWPNDRRKKWEERFGSRPYKMKWRQVGRNNDITELRSLIISSEGRIDSSELCKEYKNQKVTTPPRQELTCQMAKTKKQAQVKTEHIAGKDPKYGEEAKRKSLIKAYQGVMKELRDHEKAERKSLNKAHEEAIKKRKVEVKTKRKALDKEYQGAIQKLMNGVEAKWKALDKTHQEVMKKLKGHEKAERKYLNKEHEEAIKKRKVEVKAKRKALDKRYQEAVNKLKNEAKAKRTALDKVQQKATKNLRDEVEANRRTLDMAHRNSLRKLKDKVNA